MTRRKKLLLALGVAAVGAVAVVVVAVVRDPRLPVRIGVRQSPEIRDARERARGFPKTVRLEPLGLTAKMPAHYRCTQQVRLACGPNGDGIVWTIAPDSRRGTESFGNADNLESDGRNEEIYSALQLAGFSGFLFEWHTTRTKGFGCAFEGWRDDPKGGYQRLSVSCEERCTSECLAVIVSTAPEGPPAPNPAHAR